jgi:hypothetical protein
MGLLRQSLVLIVCSAAACAQARADDLTLLQPNLPQMPGAKVKPHKPHKLAPSQADGLNGVNFSNPYAPPQGTTQVKKSVFPAPPYQTPTEPKGGLSIFAGRAGPDDPMTGGLKLGF